MKYNCHIIAVVMSLVLGFNACSEDILPDDVLQPTQQSGDDINLSIGFQFTDKAPMTRSLVSGSETRVSTMALICFNENGQYVGYRLYDASVQPASYNSGKPVDSNGEAYFGIVPEENDNPDKGHIYAAIPKATTRIHFVANHPRIETILHTFNVSIDSEGSMMRSINMTSGLDDNICYWGYVRKETINEMAVWAEGAGETVYLIRDRAKVILNSVSNTGQLQKDWIKSVQWTAVNGRGLGFIAPYNVQNISDPFGNYFGTYTGVDNNSHVGATTNGIHEVTSADRYNITTVDNFVDKVTADLTANGTLFAPNVTGTSNLKPLYLFEDANVAENNPVKLIVAVTYQQQGSYPEETRYHTVLLKDEVNQVQFEVTRNHTYKLNITGLPRELGKATLADAIASTDYSNGQMINVSEEATDVTDGANALQIMTTSGTSVVFQEPLAGGFVKIPFKYYAIDSNPNSSTYNQPKYDQNLDPSVRKNDPQRKTIPLFIAQWTVNHGLASQAATDLYWVYNPGSSTGKVYDKDGNDVTSSNSDLDAYEGYIYLKLNAITSSLRDGKLWFRDLENGLQRYVNVYSISQYKFREVTAQNTDGTVFEKLSTTHNGNAVYHLKLAMPNDPNDYPEGLYPIEISFATKTLNAFSDLSATQSHGTFGVKIENTDDLTQQGTNTWCSDAKSWDYWYTYSILTKNDFDALNTQYGTNKNEINLYFEDVRGKRGTQPADVGLYMTIKYFGGTKSFSFGTTASINLNQQ